MVQTIIPIQLGIILLFIWKSQHYIQHGTFKPLVWWCENKYRFGFASIFGLVLGVTIVFYPESVAILQNLGINMDSHASPVLIGLLSASATYSPSNKKPSEQT